MNIEELRAQIPWTRTDLVRHAGLDFQTVKKAEEGGLITVRVAVAIAKALSEGLGREITVNDIDGLTIKGVRDKKG